MNPNLFLVVCASLSILVGCLPPAPLPCLDEDAGCSGVGEGEGEGEGGGEGEGEGEAETAESIIDRLCTFNDGCFGENPGCEATWQDALARAGGECPLAEEALAAAADCLEEAGCDDTLRCDPTWDAFYDEVFFCYAGPPPPGEPFPEPRVYERWLVPEEECEPAVMGNCVQLAELCPDTRAKYMVTDIMLDGRYAVDDGQLTLELVETGGETPATVTFTVEDEGDRLVRSDGAVFVWDKGAELVCDP